VTNAFETPGSWFRCALHAHTTASDGELGADMLVRHYEWAGYDVLAITDHWARTVEASTKGLLVIPSAELDAKAPTMESDAHVLALGVEADPVLPEGEWDDLAAVVGWVEANGGVPYLAHTYWSGLRTEQWWDVEGIVGIEVWNSGCELELGRGDSSIHWDEALERGRPLHALATDDSHHPGFDSGFAWTWVRAAERTQPAILDALRSGAFYGSTGPEILAVDVDEHRVVVECSPAASVTLLCGRKRGARANAGRLGYPHNARALARDDRGLLTRVELERPWDGGRYGRVEVLGEDGTKAWTNALWIA
jgi:predicted metal-dependent phosphoesterase TrpH